MNNIKNRKYPRVVNKSRPEEDDCALTLSVAAAVGIVAFTFIQGLIWGYVVRKGFE